MSNRIANDRLHLEIIRNHKTVGSNLCAKSKIIKVTNAFDIQPCMSHCLSSKMRRMGGDEKKL